MASAVEQLKGMIVKNPRIKLDAGDVCFFMANARIGKPYQKTTVTTKEGPGIGVSVPVTKHFGLGLFKRKVTTEVKTQTAWKETPCTLYMLGEKFAFSIGSDIHYIDYDKVTEMKLHKDAFVIGSNNYTFYMFMAGRDTKKLLQISQLLQQAIAEGATMSDFGFYSSNQIQTQTQASTRTQMRSTVVVNNKPDSKTAQSDFAKTLFINAFSRKASPVKKRDEYPSYFYYDLGIQNASTYHKQLIKDGFFEEAKAEDLLTSFKVDKLKEILSAHELDTKGKKAVLIQRIAENIPQAQIALLIPEKLYVVSDYGMEFIAEHDDYLKIHQNKYWNISYQEYDAAKAKNPSLPFYDVCWGIFNARILANKGNVRLDRNEYYNMYLLLMCEEKKERALEYLLRVLFIDVNVEKFFAPGIVKGIGELEEYYKPIYIDKLYNSRLPKTGCNKETFKAIVESIMRGDFCEDDFIGRLR